MLGKSVPAASLESLGDAMAVFTFLKSAMSSFCSVHSFNFWTSLEEQDFQRGGSILESIDFVLPKFQG